jgi:hypothetical protein
VPLALMDSSYYGNWHWVGRGERYIVTLDCLYICVYGIILFNEYNFVFSEEEPHGRAHIKPQSNVLLVF